MLASPSGLALFGLALCTLCELGLGGQISAGPARVLEFARRRAAPLWLIWIACAGHSAMVLCRAGIRI